MSTQAGNLHWRRARLTLEAGDTIVDTLLEVARQAYNATGGPSDPVDPPLGILAASPGPADGTTPASRVMIIPQPPMAAWADISTGEPYVDSTTGRVNVVMTNSGGGGGGCEDVTFNLVFTNDPLVPVATYVVTEDLVGPNCAVTLEIAWDTLVGPNPTLADAETELELAGYVVNWAGFLGGTDWATSNFPVAPDTSNTWSTTEVCSANIQWDMANLVGPGLFGPLVDPQPPESPPNVLIGTVDAPVDTFGCGASTVELNVLFVAPHTRSGPVKCATYNP
jgi:hypothetical protein